MSACTCSRNGVSTAVTVNGPRAATLQPTASSKSSLTVLSRNAPANATGRSRTTSPGHYRFYWLRTSPTGRYRVALPPGYYTVQIKERIGIGRNIRPARVHVRAGHVDTIDFRIDTGIR